MLRLGVRKGVRPKEGKSLTYQCLPRKEMWLRKEDAH